MKLDFLEEIPINIQSALQQLLGRFQSVDDGLPELIKNAKDQYVRLSINDRLERVIIIAIETTRRSLAVIDFAGASAVDFRHWQKWADPNAADRGQSDADVEGGHGNGGKGFMVRGSTDDSFFESCRDGRRTRMGYSTKSEDRLYYPAFALEDGKRVDDIVEKKPRKCLEAVLLELGVKFAALPRLAQTAFETRQAFTAVQINSVRDWSGRRSTVLARVNQLHGNLVNHAQAALSVETCSIFLIVDGVCQPNALERCFPEPLPGFEVLAPLAVPSELPDPATGESVVTGASDAGPHFLQLRTSATSLRMPNKKALNVIRVRNSRNVIGNWSVADLHNRLESAMVFGELRMSSMGAAHQIGADRVALADTPLVRALREWTAGQVSELVSLIAKSVSKEHRPQEVERVNDGLQKMRELMRTFIKDNHSAGHMPGERSRRKVRKDEEQDDDDDEPTERRPAGQIVNQIVLEHGAQGIALARGTSVPVLVRAYELPPDAPNEKRQVRRPTLDMLSSPPNIVTMAKSGLLTAEKAGRAMVWMRDKRTGVESNKVEVEVVEAIDLSFERAPGKLLRQGEEVQLRIAFRTTRPAHALEVVRSDLAVEGSVDESMMGRIDRYGVFTAGGREGTVTVRVKYGGNPSQTRTLLMEIGKERVPERRRRKIDDDGSDIPAILLCGMEAPGLENYAPEQRTINPSEQWPTIIDYEPPYEPNTIFINPDSKEAIQARTGRNGRRGAVSSGIASESFLQFLALKCFEIVKRLHVRQNIKSADGRVSELNFRELSAQAELDCSAFIEAGFEIAREISAAAKADE